MSGLVIAHNIFLTKDQRYELADNDDAIIEVVGFSNVTLTGQKNNDFPEEIFCKYIISNKLKKHMVYPTFDGYKIHLHNKKYRKSLKDIIDKGSASIMTVYKRKLKFKNKKTIENTNYISIHDVEVLESTLSQ